MKLSVLVTTYNHAPFIAQSLESVVGQVTDFDYEIVIADDCSTDGTRQLVEEFAARHPRQTRLILPEANLGDAGNPIFFLQLAAARGEYSAMLDGDDYWTEPTKLQRQVDLLDARPECSTCFHDVDVVYEDDRPGHRWHQEVPFGQLTAKRPEPLTGVADIVRGNFIASCSAVFRTPAELPDWFYRTPGVDWTLHVLNAERGPMAYIDESMGVYRIHGGGAWSARQSRLGTLEDIERLVSVHEAIDRHFHRRFHREISDDISLLYGGAALAFRDQGSRELARICARRSLRSARPKLLARRWRTVPALLLAALDHRGA
jgi:glycosyltransferase involved in cell wall biosynthesis